MALSKEKKDAIIRAEERFLQDQDERYNEFIWELSMQFNLEESTVRRVLGVE
jgi:hypothetical protein